MVDIVVDSSVLIEHLRGSPAAFRLLERAQRDGEVYVPALAAWELWKGATTPRRRSGLSELLSTLSVDPFTAALSELAGETYRTLSAQGRSPPTYDLLIASHALLRDLELATVDRDYRKIPGLRLLPIDSRD
jgi:predicted nucleic acid-binding protein